MYVYLTTYIYPKVIAIVTWVIAILFPQDSARHDTISVWTNLHCRSFPQAALLTKIRVQGKYDFTFKLHLMVTSIRNSSFSSVVPLKSLDIMSAT